MAGRPDRKTVHKNREGEKKQTYWLHPSSYTYRTDPPGSLLQTLWVAHPGWGYLRRRDLWIETETSADDLHELGYQRLDPDADEDLDACPFCGMLIVGIPGALMKKHVGQCGGLGEDWMSLEDALISDIRLKRHEQAILEAARKAKEEAEYQEKRERFEKIRQDNLARQMSRDRKRRLKEQTKDAWKKR